jgi:hypothetical protein
MIIITMAVPLTCEQVKQKLNGSIRDRVEIAKIALPDECACEVFDELSRDTERLVRFSLSKNTEIPDKCSCEIFGRLSKDKDSGVRTFTQVNDRFRVHCGGMPDTKQMKWFGFDAEREEIDCKNKCNIDVLKGQFSVDTDADVISIINTRDETNDFLEKEGFIEKPKKITWYRELDTLDNYIKDVKKGRDIRKGLNSLEKGKRNEDVEIIFDKGLKNEERYRQWYSIYKKNIESFERGRVVLKENEYPKRFTALYALKDGKLIGGRMINEKPDYNSVAYSAFERGHKWLDEIAYAKMIEYTLDQNKKKIHLGVDTNFYGYQLSPGIYKSKILFGFTPRGYEKSGEEMFLVRKNDKFGDMYMFLSTDGQDMDNLTNNIFVKNKQDIDTKDYFAPRGVVVKNL